MKHHVKKDEWVNRFRAIGLDESAMQKWHKLVSKESRAENYRIWQGSQSIVSFT